MKMDKIPEFNNKPVTDYTLETSKEFALVDLAVLKRLVNNLKHANLDQIKEALVHKIMASRELDEMQVFKTYKKLDPEKFFITWTGHSYTIEPRQEWLKQFFS